jgi:methionyl-tRNA synthetase
MITIEDFKKVDLIVARIKEVKDHPNADKLYVVKVDTGQEERQLVAGIKMSYSKEALLNRNVIIISNIQPAVIRGEESQGMLLAVSDEQGIAILTPDRDIAPGLRVR